MSGALQGSRVEKKTNRRSRRKKAMMSEINVTPMVDVMLVLLIIFMVTAPLMATGIKVNLPESNVSQLENKKEDEPIQVLVDKTGGIWIQKTKILMPELAAKLREVTKQNTQIQIYIRGDKDTSYGVVVSTISAINEAGFSRVGLVTQPRKPQQ